MDSFDTTAAMAGANWHENRIDREAVQCATRGALLLDLVKPGWEWRIDLQALEFNGHFSPVMQLFDESEFDLSIPEFASDRLRRAELMGRVQARAGIDTSKLISAKYGLSIARTAGYSEDELISAWRIQVLARRRVRSDTGTEAPGTAEDVE